MTRVLGTRWSILALALGACIVGGLHGIGCGPAGDVPVSARNVVLVVVDTLRSDHLGSYGYARDTSPHIDALARVATLYSRAMASSPWTLPSHASIFTGLDPFEHGAHSFFTTEDVSNVLPLDLSHRTLAEALRERGFATAGFVANTAFLAPRLQLDQGFDTYEVVRETARGKNRRIFDWIDATGDDAFFLFVNVLDAHRPYNTEPRPGFLDPPAPRDPRLLGVLRRRILATDEAPPAGLVQAVVDQYDTGIAHADEALGALIGHLRARDLYDKTVIVVTSDHGEYFGEHDLVEHSKDLYQEALRVPLVIKSAGQRVGRRDDTAVSSADVPRLIALELPALHRVALEELFPRPAGSRLIVAENYYSRTADLRNPLWGERFRRVRRAVFDWPYKYISSSDGANELYDLDEDPAEETNLVDEQAALAQRLAGELESRASTSGSSGEKQPPNLSDAEREELRSLGYLEGAPES